jgi:hypothetical protein
MTVMQDQVDDRRLLPVRQRRRIAADRRSDDRKNARADDRANAQRRQRNRTERLLQRGLGLLTLDDQLVDRFGGEDLSGFGIRSQGAESSLAAFSGLKRL